MAPAKYTGENPIPGAASPFSYGTTPSAATVVVRPFSWVHGISYNGSSLATSQAMRLTEVPGSLRESTMQDHLFSAQAQKTGFFVESTVKVLLLLVGATSADRRGAITTSALAMVVPTPQGFADLVYRVNAMTRLA